jgi:hypothetical protein
VRCAVNQSGRVICENSQRGSPTAMTTAMRVTARLPPQCSKNMRGRRDNHRRFEVPATTGSRPIAGGRLCGGTVSEVFRTSEWICRRSNRSREALSCEGVMRQPEACKHQVCDHCGGRFGMVTHRWWGNKFCKRASKTPTPAKITTPSRVGSSLGSSRSLVAPVLPQQLQLPCSRCCLRPPTQRRAKSDQ